MDYYDQIFKRKSFHIFRGAGTLADAELRDVENFIKNVRSLNDKIKTEIIIVPQNETNCRCGGEYCILFYSESKDGYLRNIGYMGEQIDLYLASKNIGALWFGIGSPKKRQLNGLDYVIMISIAKMPEDKFRKDMFKSKRKPICEIWKGDTLGVAEIARFSPSACNSQPWIVENEGANLRVFRDKKSARIGMIPVSNLRYYNRIDIGIFLFILETCLAHEDYKYKRILFEDSSGDDTRKTLVAKYIFTKE